MKISAVLNGVSSLAIDSAPFIYFVERNPTYRDRVRAIFKLIDSGDLQGLTSVITLTEVLVQPIKIGRTDLQRAYENILIAGQNFKLVPVDVSIAEQAAQLRAKYNLRTPDALQIAPAIQTGCEAFLTNDRRLNRVTELTILVLDDLEI